MKPKLLIFVALIASVALNFYQDREKYAQNTKWNHLPQMMNNDSLHHWATNTALHAFPDDKSGAYDVCWSPENKEIYQENDPQWFDVQNACAIILEGAEW
jgi:hypothetical protein